ncbi:MAG TPA: MlaD family protein [Deltaproteobacteria bacterium]|nr:MlaD family protein [Deltaproteobacteria bacterium]
MSRKTNTALLGAFVLGGILLAVVMVTVLGAGRFFTRLPTYVMYFSGSVKGLNVGAPVVFRGVAVGKVSDVSLSINAEGTSVRIPVVVEIDPGRISGDARLRDTHALMRTLVERGLKAQLQMQNLLTGQLIIELDFHPEAGPQGLKISMGYPEIPTVPSSMEQLTKTIENLPIEELLRKLIQAVEGVEKAVTSPDVARGIQSLNLAINDVRRVAANIDRTVTLFSSDMHGAVTDARVLITDSRQQITDLKASLEQTSAATRAAMQQTQKTMRALEMSGSVDSPLMLQLSRTMEELDATAASIRSLSDYLSRHPEAILRGKPR